MSLLSIAIGTPYWMAPEIIEMAGPTTACDIWSVGCTIIELLTGKPPYYDIAPMAALYRIVQDDQPPLPEGISPALEDFLSKCFKKEPVLRMSASELLRHRWIKKERDIDESNAIKATEKRKSNKRSGQPRLSGVQPQYQDPTVIQPQETNNAFSSHRNSSIEALQDDFDHENTDDELMENERKNWRKSIMNTVRMSGLVADLDSPEPNPAESNRNKRFRKASSTVREESGRKPIDDDNDNDSSEKNDDEEEEEDWDKWYDKDDHAQQKTAFAGNDPQAQMQIEGQWRALNGSGEANSPQHSTRPVDGIVVSNIDVDDLEDAFSGDQQFIISSTSTTSLGQKTSSTSFVNKRQSSSRPNRSSLVNSISKLDQFKEDDNEETFDEFDFSTSDHFSKLQVHDSSLESSFQQLEISQFSVPTEIAQSEDNLDIDGFADWGDDDETDFKEDAHRSLIAQYDTEIQKEIRLLNRTESSTTVLQACDNLAELLHERNSVTQSNQHQQPALLTNHGLLPIMEMLEVSDPHVLQAVLRVVGIMMEVDPNLQEILSLTGLIPMVSKFVGPSVVLDIRLAAAELVEQLVHASQIILQMFIACGGVKVLVDLLIPNVTTENPTPPAKDRELSEDTVPNLSLARVAIQGIQTIFKTERGGGSRVPKNDFFQLFAKADLLPNIVRLLSFVQHQCLQYAANKGTMDVEGDMDDASENKINRLGDEAKLAHANNKKKPNESQQVHCLYRIEITEILLMFSRGDARVKKYMAQCQVLGGIIETITLCAKELQALQQQSQPNVTAEGIEREIIGVPAINKSSDKSRLSVETKTEQVLEMVCNLLKCIKNLSMESSIHGELELASCIPTLVPFLSIESKSMSTTVNQLEKEVKNMVVLSMFYLCRLNQARREQAAVSGIIVPLKKAISNRTPVKTFALLMLCDLAHATSVTRQLLWRYGGMDFFLDLLVSGDAFWQEKALMSLEAWLSNSTPEVERALLTPFSLQRIISLFQTVKSTCFENCAKTLLDMLTKSSKLTQALGRSGLFVEELILRLGYPKAEVRIILLKMLKMIGDTHQDLQALLLDHNLIQIIAQIEIEAQQSHRVLVVEIANQLLQAWTIELEKLLET